jgi:hypothetical protein
LVDVMANPVAALVSTAKAFDGTLLAAVTNYGLPAACAWAVVQVMRAVRRRLRTTAG